MPTYPGYQKYLGIYLKHLGMLATKKLNKRSATFNWDKQYKLVTFSFDKYFIANFLNNMV